MNQWLLKKAKQNISFEFGDLQLLDIMNSDGGATSLDSLSKLYKTLETKRFFPWELYDHPDQNAKHDTSSVRRVLQ